VPDVRPLIARSACSIAPLQRGGGTRLKILEAMAIGTPVVATSKGAEGIGAINGEHLLIADSPAEFAHAVTRVLAEPALGRRLSENARQLVRTRYDWAGIMPHFLSLVEHTARRGPAAQFSLAHGATAKHA
jgi:glycosyltransferase involved in cell wall biosynthesis